jgi:beta-galactosidase
MIQRRDFLKAGTAALVYGASRTSFSELAAAQPPVSYDERSVILNGRRVLMSCGEIHYPRSTRAMWPTILELSKALGLNTIATYVFWNFHETSRGVFGFSGDRDLGHYLDLCKEHGLSVFLRVGPYICAEWNYGGFPPYLRDEPGITIRTMNKPYMDRVEAYYERLAEVIKPHLASNGGPVILVQVENEYGNVSKRYGDAGQEYLRWIVELATRVGFAGVPTTTCEGGAQGAIETSNGFSIPQQRIDTVRKTHPGTPLLWTELYPAWYRVWGGGIAQGRGGPAMAAGILDFVSRGGSGWNYYPWHGGTNFGRTSMYLQTPTYDFFAPLDEYGTITESGAYLGRFHGILQEHRTTLLEGDRTETTENGERTVVWHHGSSELRLVQEIPAEPEHRGPFGQSTPHAKLLDTDGKTIFDLNETPGSVAHSFSAAEWKPVHGEQSAPLVWQTWQEPLPEQRTDKGVVSLQPVEQLLLTKDATDYCWYSTTLHISAAGPRELVIPYGGDFFYVYLDGKLVATSKIPLKEDRGPITPDDPTSPRIVANTSEVGHENGFRHSFSLPELAPGAHRLDLLACALGMVKGDWQIASPMNFERKGIWEGVLWNDAPLSNWTMRAGLVGEQRMSSTKTKLITWTAEGAQAAEDSRPLRWHRAEVQIPENLLGNSAVFRLDANGLGKGMMWVNGHAVGRHWLILASRPAGTPSQRYYHVPADWLRAQNEIILFEEQAASPVNVQLQVRT